MRDTIFAPATAPGRGAVAIVRVSGPQSAGAIRRTTGRPPPPPRRASVRILRTADSEMVDEAVVLWLPGPASFTGEDSAEFHVHGGPAVVSAVVDLLRGLGLRLADPGEFTRRAFENGRLDLAQAEAVADLVDSETSAQRRQALGQLGGALSQRYLAWRERLLDALALLEAEVDFPDEDEVHEMARAAEPVWTTVRNDMIQALGDATGESVREGFRIALVGAPNVGKSSLLNILTGRDAAIVTEISGTTRDIIEVSMTVAGRLVRLADTAGLRETEDVIEAEGVRRARSWANAADLRIGVVDRSRPQTVEEALAGLRVDDLIVLNKSDVSDALPMGLEGLAVVQTSASPDGVTQLKATLENRLRRESDAEFPAITRARHRGLVEEAVDHLGRNNPGLPAELAAENVRLALRSLERVLGVSNPDAVLDRVFASFCLGK